MKRSFTLFLSIICILMLAGCGLLGPHTETDYAAAIMVDGEVYYLSGTVSEEIDENNVTGYTSYVDSYPAKNGECNFSRESVPYVKLVEGIAVLYENEWRLCKAKDDTIRDISESKVSGEHAADTEPPSDGSDILEEPPALIVRTWDQTLEAMLGTTSWFYNIGGDKWTGFNSDSAHPLDENTKDIMPRLYYTLSSLEIMRETDAILCFSTVPDKITVRCWTEEYWGDPGNDEKWEGVPVYEEEPAGAPVTGKDPYIKLKEGGYIYEIVAEWNSSTLYHGTAYYSFYAAPACDTSGEDGKVSCSLVHE